VQTFDKQAGLTALSPTPYGLPESEQDFSVWPIRSGLFGLSHFGLGLADSGRFGLGTFWSRHFCA